MANEMSQLNNDYQNVNNEMAMVISNNVNNESINNGIIMKRNEIGWRQCDHEK